MSSTVKHRLRRLMRTAKHAVKDYSAAERNVLQATSNDPWPAPSSLLAVVCLSLDDPGVYDPVLMIVLRRLQDRRQMTHIKKSLIVVEYCLRHCRSARFIQDMRVRLHVFRSLTAYRYLLHGQDKGNEVRQAADAIIDLLNDDLRLQTERAVAQRTRVRIQGYGPGCLPYTDADAMIRSHPAHIAFAPSSPSTAPSSSPSGQSSSSSSSSSESATSASEGAAPVQPLAVVPVGPPAAKRGRGRRTQARSAGPVVPVTAPERHAQPDANAWLLDYVPAAPKQQAPDPLPWFAADENAHASRQNVASQAQATNASPFLF
ncbi:ENTH domain-containing protein [Plasmodiophora brassicae]